MDELSQLKQLPIIQAMAYIATGKSKVKACSLAGISTSTLDRAIEANPEIVTDFVIEQKAKINDMFTEVLGARQTLIRSLIASAQSGDLEIKESLAIEGRLRDIQKELEVELKLIPDVTQQTGAQAVAQGNAEAFLAQLTGPILKTGKSIITRTTTTESIELNLGNEVIEGKVEETS